LSLHGSICSFRVSSATKERNTHICLLCKWLWVQLTIKTIMMKKVILSVVVASIEYELMLH
jgi:hypothetical protein